MVIILSMESLVKDGKLLSDAKNAILNLTKADKLIIVSKTGNITVNTETLNLLTHVVCQTEVAEYANTNAMLLNIGMELAGADRMKIVMKAEDASVLKDILKGNEKVSFGWNDVKAKKRPAKVKSEPSENKKIPEKKEKAEKKEEKKSAGEPVIKKRVTGKKEEPKGKKTKDEVKEASEKKIFTVEEVKKAVGGRHSMSDWEKLCDAFNGASDSDLGIDFLLKIKVPILYQDEAFVEKAKKAYIKLNG